MRRGSAVVRLVGVALVGLALVACNGSSSSRKKRPALDKATNPSPADGATSVVLQPPFSWDPVPDATSYDVYLGTTGPDTFIGNFLAPTANLGALNPGTRYFWRVDPTDGKRTTTGDVWTFTTHVRGEDRTLVIDNAQSPMSVAIADYYIGYHPNVRRLTLDVSPTETVNRATYDADIRTPVIDYLTVNGLLDEVWYIVLCKGVPLRISGNAGSVCVSDERASVDNELAHLDPAQALPGKRSNPFFNSSTPFSRPAESLYLVCRLTGYETDADLDGIPDDVKALIDRGANPTPGPTVMGTGQFVLDVDPNRDQGGFLIGNTWMRTADANLSGAGFNTLLDETNLYVTGESEVLGYCSWGSNDANNNTPPFPTLHDYIPGAIVTTYVSTNARTFTSNPTYGQSLVADLVLEGVTGANGHVYEPCLDAVSRPQILFDRYTSGWNLAESYYASIVYLSWMNVVVGDPLCSPWE